MFGKSSQRNSRPLVRLAASGPRRGVVPAALVLFLDAAAWTADLPPAWSVSPEVVIETSQYTEWPSWDARNLFVLGDSVFPQNSPYNPTLTINALAYHALSRIKGEYLSNRRPLDA